MADLLDCEGLMMVQRCVWRLVNGQLRYDMVNEMDVPFQLYAFVLLKDSDDVLGEVKYVGKTRKTLRQRFVGYVNPGQGQATNRKVNCFVKLALNKGYRVETYSFQDNTPLQWNGINLNIPAGIEDAVIDHWRPEWNFIRNSATPCNDKRVTSNLNMETNNPASPIKAESKVLFKWTLGKTYYRTGYMNPGVKVDEWFGQAGENVQLFLPNGAVYEATIDRNANLNKTVRLGFNGIIPFLRENFTENQEVFIEILEKNKLRLVLN